MQVTHRGFALVLLAVSVSWCGWPQAARAAPTGAVPNDIPRALEDWRAWALKGREFLRCPFIATLEPSAELAHRCVWPERLQLEADAHGGRFAQRWEVFSESWVALPGDASRWPQDVMVDGRPAAVVARGSTPYVRLNTGTHALSGRWSWDVRPETLPIPAYTALLELTVDGKPIGSPQLADGRVALGAQKQVVEPRQLDLQIHRLIEDGEPVRLETRIQVRAAGDAREESLGRILPDGFTPLALESPIPARLDANGNLRAQVRPGSFELTLIARQAQPNAEFRAPGAGSLVREEIWSFAPDDRLRVATVEGAPGIDPAQAQVPEDWRQYPAFRLASGEALRIVERSRGLSNADQNRLRLHRSLWLDFDHEGWTAQDELTGTLRRDWRLDLRAPYRLESATAEGQPLLVTRGAEAGATGVEVRTPALALTALSRIDRPFSSLPATGWTQPLEAVSGELHLPPGHRLLAVLGADASPTAWLDRWGLWSLFGLLVVVAFTRWVAGWRVAAVGGIGLLLTYQTEPGLIWGWGNLLVAVALARAATEGRLARWARLYRNASFVLLALALLPFAWSEVHQAIYPQLEIPAYPPPILTQLTREPVANAPAPEARLRSAASAASGTLANEVVLTANKASRAPQALAPYAPNTLIQAGPGVPEWNYGVHPFSWSGPVDPGQTVRFVVLGRWEVTIWRIAGVVLLVAFLIQLARTSYGSGPGMSFLLWRPWRSATAMLTLLIAALSLPQPARAQSFPTPELLRDLKARLTEAPRCAPTCAELLAAQVQVRGEEVQVELTASALAELAVAVPSGGDRWRIDSVTVDGKSSLAVARDSDGALWVPLVAGVHVVRMDARLAGDSLHLNFPMTPRRVAVDAPGWTVAGIKSNSLLSGAIDLTRQRRVAAGGLGAGAASQEFPAFVRVVREFRMGVDWSIATTVERIAPSESAFTVGVPLVSGESVLTEGLQIEQDHSALVGFAAGEGERAWSSSLQRVDRLSLSLPAAPAREEVWRFVVSPQWRVTFAGLPAVLPENANTSPWVFEYHPRAGEVLTLEVSRPAAVAGSALAFDRVDQSIDLGRHSSEHELRFQYRSTQGARHTISLPKDADVTRVSMDDTPIALRPENGELALSLLPGKHTVDIAWRSRIGASLAVRPDRIDLHAPASNVRTTLSFSADRWPLFALGTGVGPAFLYWGELVVFLIVSFLLARTPYSPLTLAEWLLLGLGLSTLSWGVLVLVAAWLFAMQWRERSSAATALARSRFNALQTGLAALTVIAVAALVFSGVRYGLLAAPDMGVTGPGSTAGTFSWFVDRASATLPRQMVFSLPMWVYRAVMFAWALWIAAALVRWLRFSWRAWTAGGYWRGPMPASLIAPTPAGRP